MCVQVFKPLLTTNMISVVNVSSCCLMFVHELTWQSISLRETAPSHNRSLSNASENVVRL